MKKLLSLVLSLMILALPLCAAAESGEAFEFVFRNGIKWGDTLPNVHALELADDNLSHKTFKEGNRKILLYLGVDVSEYSAQLEYFFRDDSLYACRYEMFFSEEKWAYMAGALSAKYGEPAATDTENAYGLLEIFGTDETPLILTSALWEMPDGTAILLYTLEDEFPPLCIAYINTAAPAEPEPTEIPAEEFNLNGL